MNVFIKCAAIEKARIIDGFNATSLNKTKTAPINASIIIKISEAKAIFRIRLLLVYLREAQINITKTATSAKPLVIRCENSIMVFSSGALGTISPPQVSQN